MAAKDPNLWLEGAKFVPGWLAFLTTIVAGARRWRHRHRLLAIGPKDDLRQILQKARNLISDVVMEPRFQTWFGEPEQRDLTLRLGDCVNRVGDRVLRDRLGLLLENWLKLSEVPVGLPAMILDEEDLEVFFEDPSRFLSKEDATALERQRAIAPVALHAVDDAVARFNLLERREIGR